MNKKLISTTFAFVLSFSFYGQQVSISDNDTTCNCSNASSIFNMGGTINFVDNGGASDYSSNANESITFCPDGGASNISVTFGNNTGFTWDVDGSDTLYVYDGPNTSSPLLGAYNSSTNSNGFFVMSSWNNPSGCLTFRFVSDGVTQGTGWEASIACANPPQPIEMHMEAYINGEANGANDLINDMNPLDTGYVDVCLGDTIMLVATPSFPFDPANSGNGGYDQINTHTINWDISTGFSSSNDTIWFVPPAQNGYLITLTVEDPFPQTQAITSVVRVSTTPSFNTCSVLSDTICENQETQLFGGITAGDTVGVEATGGSIEVGGVFATLTPLPDGSGLNYNTDINIAGYPGNATIQSISDINRICLSMEHSYLGDLEMRLTCPNGQSVNIFNAFGGNGLFPGGFGGGGTYLGGALDGNTGNIGVCEEYCFSERPNSLSSWAALAGSTGLPTTPATGPSVGNMITPGTYNPEESFIPALQGCPINGDWTITVRDNLGIDDGFICEWGIFFDATLNPNNETYRPYIVNEFWSPDPTIVSGDNDTSIIVRPPKGITGYIFNVEDNFGCSYDTTIYVEVIQGPSIGGGLGGLDSIGCINNSIQFSNTYAPEGGNWSYEGPGNITFFPNTTFINPAVSADVKGTYEIIFIDNQCSDTTTQEVIFLPLPTATVLPKTATICSGDSVGITLVTSDPNNIIWNNDSLFNTTTITVSAAGTYTANVTNECGTASDSFELVTEDCVVPNVITPNGDGINDFFYTNIANTYSDVHLIIYNRWGRKVYENKNYDNSWNGATNNGSTLTSATYFYVLTYKGGSRNENGFIQLVK